MAIDTGTVKQFFKDADGPEAVRMYEWATAAMEVRGLVTVNGGPTRKRRSDAGTQREAKPAAGDQLALREPAE